MALASQQGFVPYTRHHPLVHIILELDVWNGSRWISTYAMIDSGATGNFINSHYLRSYFDACTLSSKPSPYYLSMADGKKKVVSRQCSTQIKIQGHHEHLSLDSTILHSYPIILGTPWLKRHDPWIHWSSHQITFNSPHCLANCHLDSPLTISSLPRHPFRLPSPALSPPSSKPARIQRSPPEASTPDVKAITRSLELNEPSHLETKPCPSKLAVHWRPKFETVEYSPENPPCTLRHPSGPSVTMTLSPPDTTTSSSRTATDPASNRHLLPPLDTAAPSHRTATHPVSNRHPLPPFDTTPRTATSPMSPGSPPRVSLVNAAAFSHLLSQKDVQLFQLDISQALVTPEPKNPDLSTVPEEYHEFAKVFSKEEADRLPEHRPYDHAIKLQPGTEPPWSSRIYSLSPDELKTLRTYIDDNLQKGFIRASQSPSAAPILFVKKPDGGLRLCVDYRGLNKVTVKNRYPLPLINELFDRLRNARYFTKCDMRDGYHRLRMAPGEEWKTAFRTRYGLYEYTVMPFGLCNAPGTFQHYVNDVFHDYMDDFMSAYLDDLMIFSKTLKEHKIHVRKILQRLEDHQLYLKPSKCEFHKTEIAFLGYIISENGISMDPAKVSAVTSWPTPRSVLDIQTFLGLANFYRRFIKNFSKTIGPITRLLQKDVPFLWDTAPDNAFQSLKKAFTTAPILKHFDYSRPATVEADASDFAQGGVLSQQDNEGILHPVAFHSRKFNPAEQNYEIYDKEMLAIVECLTTWRHYLQGTGQQIKVITDHKNLLWFTETKIYNRRQARWAEKLSHFDFTIIYRPGPLGIQPDALSRRPDHQPQKGGKDKNPNEFQFLKPHQVTDFPLEEATKTLMAATADPETPPDVLEDIKNALPNDEQIAPYLQYLRDPTIPRSEDTQEYLEPFTMEDDVVLKHGLIYVPAQDAIKTQVLQAHHDAPLAGHLGQDKTYELISRNYTWPNMRQWVNEYINTCETCIRNKTPRQRPHGPLKPLTIPPGPWKSVSMDFIVELPPSQGHDAIYVCVDRFTKMAHFSATTSAVTAKGTARLFLCDIVRLHGLPADIVSDRGTQFTAKFTKRLLELCDIKGNLSTAFHPQSDGQTERVNQVLEQYLRIFCDYQQDDWYDLLPLAEFAYNNAKHASTQTSPFYANYGQHPRMSLVDAARRIETHRTDPANPAADTFIEKIERVHNELRETLRTAQLKYKAAFDTHVQKSPPFQAGELVWLSRKYIKTRRPSVKLDAKRLGPFKILEVVGEAKSAFRLELPPQMRIHPVFHVSLLTPHRASTIPGRVQPRPPPDIIDGTEEYEVHKILDSRIQHKRLEYLVDWVGYSPDERTWEPIANIAHAAEALEDYHRGYPNRPSPNDIPQPLHRSTAPKRGGTVRNR